MKRLIHILVREQNMDTREVESEVRRISGIHNEGRVRIGHCRLNGLEPGIAIEIIGHQCPDRMIEFVANQLSDAWRGNKVVSRLVPNDTYNRIFASTP